MKATYIGPIPKPQAEADAGRGPSVPHLGPEEALGEEHDLADLLQVGHDHHHRPEERLHRLGQLRAACVAGVHGDEDAHSWVQ